LRTFVVIAALLGLLAAPSGALAQGGGPFEPLPPAPPETPEQPAPVEVTSAEEDDDFSAVEWLLLGGVALALLGGVAWAIAREGGGFQRGRRRRRDARASAKGHGKPGATTAQRGKDAPKAPPPPPRKQRQAAATKRRAKGKARTKAKRR
jgi:hypothetical protein